LEKAHIATHEAAVVLPSSGSRRIQDDHQLPPSGRDPVTADHLPAGEIKVAALADAATQTTAPIIAATPNAEGKAGPEAAITGPMRAVATRPPVRATALLSPDAAPV
jgi:hypothetical protein